MEGVQWILSSITWFGVTLGRDLLMAGMNTPVSIYTQYGYVSIVLRPTLKMMNLSFLNLSNVWETHSSEMRCGKKLERQKCGGIEEIQGRWGRTNNRRQYDSRNADK